jgi:hypothetical protein
MSSSSVTVTPFDTEVGMTKTGAVAASDNVPTTEAQSFFNYDNLIKFLEYTPVINFFYDLFFDDVPTVDNIKELLNLIGLIDALVLGISFSVITAVDFDGNIEADQRFMSHSNDTALNGYNELYESGDHWRLNEAAKGAPSAHFAENNMRAITWLFSSLILVLVVYFDIVNKNFEGTTPSRSARLIKSWWDYGRLVIVVSGAAAFMGIVEAIAAAVPLIYINYPDYFVEKYGRMTYNTNYPYQMAETYLFAGGWASLVFGIVVVGVATMFNYKELNRQKKLEEKSQTGRILSESAESWEKFFSEDPKVAEYFDEVHEEYVEIFVEQKFDFEDRRSTSDAQLSAMGIMITGHRIKLLQLFLSQ